MTTNILPPAEDKPKRCYNCGEAESACKCPAEESVDLDAWRAEAGAALEVANAATEPPWEAAEEIVLYVAPGADPTPPWNIPAIVDDNGGMREADAHLIAAARTGWPRDAARVARLCDEVATLRAALGEALDELDSALSVATGVCAMTSECRARDRLRALLSDDFMRLDPS